MFIVSALRQQQLHSVLKPNQRVNLQRILLHIALPQIIIKRATAICLSFVKISKPSRISVLLKFELLYLGETYKFFLSMDLNLIMQFSRSRYETLRKILSSRNFQLFSKPDICYKRKILVQY